MAQPHSIPPSDNLPERRDKQNDCVKLRHLHMHQGSKLFPIFLVLSPSLHRHPTVAFTPSIQRNLVLPRARLPLASAIDMSSELSAAPLWE